MNSMFSYLITMFAVIYWGFRVVVSLMGAMQLDFICQPVNANIEILILFLTIPCIVFIIRRNVIAATLYFGMYAAYFGTIVYQNFTATQSLDLSGSTELLLNSLGIIIPFLVFCDVMIQKSGIVPQNKGTDWYYENEKYDREFDERADRNQYKIK